MKIRPFFLIKNNRLLTVLFLGLLITVQTKAQYTLNGDAKALSDSCFLLTPDRGSSIGTVWYEQFINLNQSFEIKAQLYFGVKDESGADGIAIVLQDVGNNTQGELGGGLGYSGFSPALAIEFDTYQNDDPPFDHIAINKNGNVGHSNLAGVVAPPIQANLNNPNIEDNQFHQAIVQWNPLNNVIRIYFDGEKRIEVNFDIRSLFTKDKIWWGFTASTGALSNEQKVCGLVFSKEVHIEDSCFKTKVDFPDTLRTCDSSVVLTPGLFKSYNWNNGDTTSTLLVRKSGMYSVKVVSTSGCKASDSVYVLIEPKGLDLQVSNVFTPNNDNFNDTFKPMGSISKPYSMEIYNRWGQLIFETNNIEKAWDGTYNNEPVIEGVYYYSIKAMKTCENKPYDFRGSVQLMR